MTKYQKPVSLKINAIFNSIYQIMALLVPLITTPYISRVLGPGPNGQYAFFYSIVSYFVIFVTFGFVDFGTKIIAETRTDNFKKTVNFASISICKLLLGIICLVFYLGLMIPLFISNIDTVQLILIFSLYIISASIDPVFYFQGEEKFISICLKNLFLKLVSTIFIFVFVKSSSDLWIYTLILALSQLASILFLFFGLRKNDFTHIKLRDLCILDTFKKSIPFFVPTLAVSLFTYLNQTILGFLVSSELESGYYSQALKVITILSTFSSSISIIMLSRIAYLKSLNNMEEIEKKISKSFQALYFISLPILFGLCAISDLFVPLFFGNGYDKCIYIIYILSPTILFSPLNTLYGNIFYRPFNKIWIQTIAIFIASIINVILSFILIPLYASIGAAVSRIIAEFTQLPILIYFARKEIKVTKILKISLKPLFCSSAMFVSVYLLNIFLLDYFAGLEILFLILLIGAGGIIYVLLELLLRDKFLLSNINSLFSFIKKKFEKKQ